jgi:acyl-CoA synthetase (AMP-forming)/AMP-acid ligase II
MLHANSLGRAARYFRGTNRACSQETRSTFRKLHERVARIAGALTRHGFRAGDRLALLLPNESDYLELFMRAAGWV